MALFEDTTDRDKAQLREVRDLDRASADFTVENHGSIFLLTPETDAGRAWATEHLPEDAPRFGGAFAVEPRYIRDIVEGAMADGLRVE